jgi:cyclopropane-fatty-acyl-phospholipid synthase
MEVDMLNKVLKSRVETALINIKIGELTLIYPDKSVISFGSGSIKANIKIKSWKTIWLAVTRGDIGLAEGYFNNHWETDDVLGLLELLSLNMDHIRDIADGSKIFTFFSWLYHVTRANSIKGSKKNILAHYDLGNDFYKIWLDKTMTYSSAYFNNKDIDMSQAQYDKYQLILDKLNLKPNSHILEIGCGWGGFIEYAALKGHQVTGITISDEQYKFALNRIKDLPNNPEIVLQDYRLTNGQYDAVVSIEMFEAVGSKYWEKYFQKVKELLKPNSKALIQTITIADELFKKYIKEPDFIQTYIFPGGEMASDSEFLSFAK